MLDNYTGYLAFVVCLMSFLDLYLTWFYIITYKDWQPEKPLNLIEKNPLLVYCMNATGVTIGMFLGGLIILGLNLFISMIHWGFGVVLIIVLFLTLVNHKKNLNLLEDLMEKYPDGHLPEKVFGEVKGNNSELDHVTSDGHEVRVLGSAGEGKVWIQYGDGVKMTAHTYEIIKKSDLEE